MDIIIASSRDGFEQAFLCQYISIVLLLLAYQPEYCEKYAKPEDIGAAPEDETSDEEPSEDEYEFHDEEMAGQADP